MFSVYYIVSIAMRLFGAPEMGVIGGYLADFVP